MIKWLKKKIEINNRREKNDKDDDGCNAWSLSSFLILFFLHLSLIAFVVFCGIAYNPISFLALIFPVFIIGWQFWHLLFYYGPKYDNKEGGKIMKKGSDLTFNALTTELSFVKVKWNGKVVLDVFDLLNESNIDKFYHEYGNRYVYSMDIKIVANHHCELKIKGEKEFKARQLVFGLYAESDIYEHDVVDFEDVEILEQTYSYENSILYNDYLKRLEFTYGKKYELHKALVKNIDKYPWIHTCTEFYVFKEI